ncbi:MAG: cardiolipin synthase [Gemmataceae bacterium]
MLDYLPHITVFALLDGVIMLVVLPWVVMTKKDTTAAVAWCLVVILMPLFGTLLFWVFGYNHVYRPLARKARHRSAFRESHPPQTHEAARGEEEPAGDDTWNHLGSLALKVKAFPISRGNRVTLFDETPQAYQAVMAAIQGSRSHIHLEYFIFRPDETGRQMIETLSEKAKEGVEVRLLYDSVGGWNVRRAFLQPLVDRGGKVTSYLSINPLRSRLQVNMRNHRKIVVVDGRLGFIGGMNIGDEYLGKSVRFGYWRDEVVAIEGPAVAGLQRVFHEDWDFAYGETLNGEKYFPKLDDSGESVVQVIESGPDQEVNSIREIYLAAISSARERLWIASPYFVPDAGLLDSLRLARYRGVDVRLLTLLRPDHFFSFYAGRYYWSELLGMDVKVYQYRRGMMHSKIILADGQWAIVGSANLDNRSLHLNFEAGCIIHTPALIESLEKRYLIDLEESTLLDARTFAQRGFGMRLLENGCRLLSPVL